MVVTKRGAMMQTCIDASNGERIDIALLSETDLHALNYKKDRQRRGVDPVCKGCEHPVNLVHHHLGVWLWRHAPGYSLECSQVEFNHSESPEHLIGKQLIARALHGIGGWDIDPEHFATADGTDVFVDVFAQRTAERAHALQVDTAFEVQLSPQSTGAFVERSAGIQSVTGARPVWVTPHRAALDATCGLIIDGTAALVVDQIYTHVDQQQLLEPTPLDQVVKGIWRSRPIYEFAQSGDILSADSRARAPWIVWTRGQGKPRTAPRRRVDPVEPEDRDCDRVPADVIRLRDSEVPSPTTPVAAPISAFARPEPGLATPNEGTTPHGRPAVSDPELQWPAYARGWTLLQWEGRARMAAARVFARIPLGYVDREALHRFPEHQPASTVNGPRF